MNRSTDAAAMPMVSVVVPVYNAERYLDACIQSVLKQDYTNFELILVNDGSKDSSGKICEAYRDADARVKYLYHDNAGVSATRNEGLDAASGKYIMFLDSDDRFRDGAIRKMVERAETEQVDLVLCGYNCVYSDREEAKTIENVLLHSEKQVTDYFFAHFLEGISSSVWAKLYRREKLTKRFRTDLSMGEDHLFHLEYVKGMNSLCAIADALYDYDQTNVSSLVRNYKPSHYTQSCIVINEWLSWGRAQGLRAQDMTNVYYRAVSLFLTFMQYTLSKQSLSKAAQTCAEAASDLIQEAIPYTAERFNAVYRIVLKWVRQKHFGCAVLGLQAYRSLQKCLKRDAR